MASLPTDRDHSGGFLSSSFASRWTDAGDNESAIDGDIEASENSGLLTGRLRRASHNRLAALTDIGGVNSIRSFTRSWQRAAGFQEVIPRQPEFQFAPDQAPLAHGAADGVVYEYGCNTVNWGQIAARNSGLLGAQIRDNSHPVISEAIGSSQGQPEDFRERERKALDDELANALAGGSPRRSGSFSSSSGRRGSIFAIPPHLATPPISTSYQSYTSYHSYGSMNSNLTDRSGMARAWQQQQLTQTPSHQPGENEMPPILVREVEQDGKIVLAVEGQSTLPQTVFNSINVLIGIGLLSLPMGFRYAGWICGMLLLAAAALVCSYTAKLLAKCMDLDHVIITFSDLAYISYGSKARVATSFLFTLELLAACVALIVLFADTLQLLFPGYMTVNQWKVVCVLMISPLNFMPLRLLSFTSIIGILCCFLIVSIVIIDGFLKPDYPGSLLQPASTYLFPEHWSTLPLSFGLLLSPWGGHSVFPNIYRDMRHPYKYSKAVKTTFSFTYLLDCTTAVVGILMFGDGVADAITSNILTTTGYPRALTFAMCGFISIIPITKIPLNARPIVNTIEVLFGVNDPEVAWSNVTRSILRVFIKFLVTIIFLVIAIVFPAFDSIMAFMGSGLCFTICIILPIAFYLKLFGHEIKTKERLLCYTIMVVSSIMSVIGVVWAFLPKELIHAN